MNVSSIIHFFIVVVKFAVQQSGLDIWEKQSQRKIYLKCLRIISCQFHLLMYVFRGFNSRKAHICLVVGLYTDIVFFFFLKIDKQASKARMEHEKKKKKDPLHLWSFNPLQFLFSYVCSTISKEEIESVNRLSRCTLL